MEKAKKKSIVLIALSLLLFVAVLSLMIGTTTNYAKALDNTTDETVDPNISTRGIYTALSISINGGNGKVWTTVRNDVTIFPSTVIVIVELYSSETFQESHLNMKLEQKVQIGDLDLHKTITAEASTGGVQKYWQGRTRYKVDNGAWKEMSTGTCLYSANGDFIRVE